MAHSQMRLSRVHNNPHQRMAKEVCSWFSLFILWMRAIRKLALSFFFSIYPDQTTMCPLLVCDRRIIQHLYTDRPLFHESAVCRQDKSL
ncbi:unnamed protein product [Ixodes persulcatus]